MKEVQRYKVSHHPQFRKWLKKLKMSRDQKLYDRVKARLEEVRRGAIGDNKSVGNGVRELILDFGPGYRIYYTERGKQLIFLLCAGDKSTQEKDIKQAKKLAKEAQSEKKERRPA